MTRIYYDDIPMTKPDTMTFGESLARREDIDNDPQDPEVGMSGYTRATALDVQGHRN